MKNCKTYVNVLAKFDRCGTVIPLRIKWEDGRVFIVDAVKEIRRAASLKGGGIGMRYTVSILGKETYLWRDDDVWFVERNSVSVS